MSLTTSKAPEAGNSEAQEQKEESPSVLVPIPSSQPVQVGGEPSNSTTANQPCFMDKVPREILDRILSHAALLPRRSIVLRNKALRKRDGGPRAWVLNILLVCRSFYHAGVEIIFGANTLCFFEFSHLDEMTQQLGPDRLSWIKSISLQPTFVTHLRRWDEEVQDPIREHGRYYMEGEGTALQHDVLARLPALTSAVIWATTVLKIGVQEPSTHPCFRKMEEHRLAIDEAWSSKADMLEFYFNGEESMMMEL